MVIRYSNFYVLCGAILFVANYFADKAINIPLGEFAVLGMLLSEYGIQRRVLRDGKVNVTIAITVFFVFWCAMIDQYHGGSVGTFVRTVARLGVFYAIIFLYILLPDKRRVLYFMTGMMVGYMLMFFGFSLYYFLIVRGEFYRLKYVIPTPGVVLFFYLIFKEYFSKNLARLFPLCLFVSFAGLPFIGGRGAFLSLCLACMIYGIYRLPFVTRHMMVGFVMFIPASSVVIIGLYGYDLLQYLFEIDYATISNVERLLMLQTSIEVMRDYPLFGTPLHHFSSIYVEDFIALTHIQETALSPHNYYMETSVPYGIPALVMLLCIWYQIYHQMFHSMRLYGKQTAYAAYAAFSIAWIMLYQPVAGITRFDVFILLVAALYGFNKDNMHRKSS